MLAPPSRRVPRPIPHPLLAALTRAIEDVAATAGPVVEATADAARGDDQARQQERLAVALRNFEAAMNVAAGAVRIALEELEGARRRSPRRK